jgi:mannosylglycerate hydrolase
VASSPTHLVLVPHTHWDREWYRTHEAFRYRLVDLVDQVLGILETDPAFRHFTLDGQTIVVDDYLEVRPGARERVEKLVRAGRLVIGPWTVLPDEWLVSGEALVRNLRLGLRRASELGGSLRLGYVPDQFGHVGQMPQILAGFGLRGAVLWRGVGEAVDRTLFGWEAPDGTRLRTIYLIHGYGNAARLPTDPRALAERLRSEAESLASASPGSTRLLMNGSDHEFPEPGLPAALDAALEQLPETSAEIGTLETFLSRVGAEAGAELPVHRGELRSGLRAPLLPGCASARAPQKRTEFQNDRLLTRYLEPLAAWLQVLGGRGDPERIDFAWRIALENHPHDSVCGCSIDAVHDQMEGRFRRVSEIAREHLAAVTRELGQRIALPAGFGRGAGAALAVWNPNGGGPACVETDLELDLPLGRTGRPAAFHLRDASGRRLPASAEVLRAAERRGPLLVPRAAAVSLLPGLGRDFDALHVNAVRTRRRGDRLEVRVRLGETREPGFDVAAEKRALAAELADESVAAVAVEAVRPPRVRLRFRDELPGQGLRVYRVARGAARPSEPLRVDALAGGGVAIENASWRVEVDGHGRVALHARRLGVRIDDALRLVSEGDRGDEYNFDPVAGGEVVERPERVRVRGLGPSGGEVGIRITATYRLPAELAASRDGRARRRVALPVELEIRLAAGLDRVDVALDLSNRARDHRLRLHVGAPFGARRLEVESAFEIAERPIAPPADAFGSARPAEFPIGAGPQRTFATLVGDQGLALSAANRGVAEVEALPGGDRAELALTILRAVGWLSRADLVLRPGPAGPLLPTPGAQVPGRHRAELSLRLHEVGDPRRIAEAHGFAWPPLAFAVPAIGAEDGPLTDGSRLVEVDDPQVVVSAVQPLAPDGIELRLVNLSGAARQVRVGCGRRVRSRLEAVDLSGRGVPDAAVEGAGAGGIRVSLRPWQILTLRGG